MWQKVVVFLENVCIRAKVVVFVQKLLCTGIWRYSGKRGCNLGKSGCNRTKLLFSGAKTGCIPAKVVPIGQKLLYSGQKWLFSGKSCFNRAKLWYSG